jgi:hypothetical protein
VESAFERVAAFAIIAALVVVTCGGGVLLGLSVLMPARLGTQVADGEGRLDVPPLVGSRVLRYSRSREIEEPSPSAWRARARLTEQLLARTPLDGDAWVSLGAERLLAGGEREKALAALDISTWTAPREGGTIARRLKLLAALYPNLSDDRRTAVVQDFLRAGQRLPPTDKQALRAIFEAWPRERYAEFTERMISRAGTPPWWLKMYGFARNT